MRVPVLGYPGLFTPVLTTPLGHMSPTAIDRRLATISGKMLDGTATEADQKLQETLAEIRRKKPG